MTRISINQAVVVHSHPPTAQQLDGTVQGDEHVHAFENLIPACEFAVSLDSEGHLNINPYTDLDGVLDLGRAHQIVKVWESGQVALDATEMDFRFVHLSRPEIAMAERLDERRSCVVRSI